MVAHWRTAVIHNGIMGHPRGTNIAAIQIFTRIVALDGSVVAELSSLRPEPGPRTAVDCRHSRQSACRPWRRERHASLSETSLAARKPLSVPHLRTARHPPGAQMASRLHYFCNSWTSTNSSQPDGSYVEDERRVRRRRTPHRCCRRRRLAGGTAQWTRAGRLLRRLPGRQRAMTSPFQVTPGPAITASATSSSMSGPVRCVMLPLPARGRPGRAAVSAP